MMQEDDGLTGTQWFIVIIFIVACWAGNKGFDTYLDKKFKLESMKQHELTLRQEIDFFKKLAGMGV